MTRSERETFLAGVHIGVLSVVEANGNPIGVPVWYTYEPGRDIGVHIDPASRKGKALTATGRFSLCAQSEELPYKYVLVSGGVRESQRPVRARAARPRVPIPRARLRRVVPRSDSR